MDLKSLIGKVFQLNPEEEYGPLRSINGELPVELKSKYKALAEDSCGNYFVTDGEGVSFWDHETSEIIKLASSFKKFEVKCVEPKEAELIEDQVESAWIDPNFLKEIGRDEKP